jgi:hypothetical protein
MLEGFNGTPSFNGASAIHLTATLPATLNNVLSRRQPFSFLPEDVPSETVQIRYFMTGEFGDMAEPSKPSRTRQSTRSMLPCRAMP